MQDIREWGFWYMWFSATGLLQLWTNIGKQHFEHVSRPYPSAFSLSYCFKYGKGTQDEKHTLGHPECIFQYLVLQGATGIDCREQGEPHNY